MKIKISNKILDNFELNNHKYLVNTDYGKFLEKYKYKKYDLTNYGHFSGTGVVLMNTNIDFELV